MNEENKFCPFVSRRQLPPCIAFKTYKWAYLKDFIEDNRKSKIPVELMIIQNIDCLQFKKNYIVIKDDKCINCMYCVFGCEKNYIEIKDNYKLFASCSNFKAEYKDKISNDELEKWFCGDLIKLPTLELTTRNVHYRNFQEFTEVDETKNIAIWGANTIRFLSKSSDCRVGTEIKMLIKTRDRGGRLDISLLSEEHLIVAEAKVSFIKMMQEGRYLTQMLAYQEEIENILKEINSKLIHYKFLLIDGSETDLLPSNNDECSSRVGDQAAIFYYNLQKHNLLFISAKALLLLGILKLFRGDKYSIENVLENIITKDGLGLLSCGVVNRKEEIVHLYDLLN